MVHTYGGRHAEGWVPVEQRWLGLDKRTLTPAIVVAVIAILLTFVVPLIDDALPQDDAIQAGQRLDLGGGIAVTPPTGWELESGIRVGETTTVPVTPGTADASFSGDGVSISIHVASFTGDTTALLDQVETVDNTVSGRRATVAAQGGIAGLAENYTGVGTAGLVAAYTFPQTGTGMTITVTAPAGQLAAHQKQIDAVLHSVSRQEQP
ncbi:hypothetical protein FB565_000392 [Actinoplanes lutulentus]|uniref:Uncharacterized protein n=1 Tax=Actinoplanes lutulentus TaxID=1287878 RepID=A0A327ZK00_9ACTN|nr:hypothetical protein [Actinoplanes lutulentus]MBB2940688.1 hypothetical protein [Actinoplanes lutulentus]RAK42999.1 hypothetical protein B0I29_101129 [Actinoplanes lutulentus]